MLSSAVLAFSAFAAAHAFVHNVQVSDHNGNLVYTPPVTIAKVGDFVNFVFSPKNHTVTQSSFGDPCTPLQNGFNSGFRPVAANLTTDFPVFTVPVLDSKPIWFHCEQGAGTNASHCGKGMVGAINPTADKTFDAFRQKALASLQNDTSTSSSKHYSGTNHSVTVSNENGTLAFFPPITNAKIGDNLIFNFFPKNHTVTQSSFDDPCSPVQYGFNSGFEPVDPQSNSPHPTFVLTVKTADPIWFYCQQGANTNASHCGKGMVGAVNTDQSKFDQFKQKALAIGASLSGNSTTAPTIHQVSVSNAGGNLTYTPPVTYAKPGEIVRFTFFPKNHTVSQSSFDNPCSPLNYGFTSGFRPVGSLAAVGSETFDITVKDDMPIWFYCQQGANTNASHCGKGMVGAINPTADNTFDEFRQKALAVGAALGATNSTPTVHQVFVSNSGGDLVYSPPVTYAKPGEVVKFTFFPKNHTVSRSSFDSPCSPLNDGFTSGFRPVGSLAAVGTENFEITVKDDKPIWFYCQQGANTNASHCGQGMVGAINPTADKTFDEFRQKALAVGASLSGNSSTAPVYHEVQVGGQDGALVYVPSVVEAKPGDFVRFTFNPKNHTVTQSSFDQPCNKIQYGIDSGFHPVSPNSYGAPSVFTIPVTDTSPKWFYCAQGAGTNASHCGQGMVFAINPTADKTFAAFRSKALAVGASLGSLRPIPL